MKKPQLHLLLTLTVVFAAFTLGLFLGRNMNHSDIQLSTVSAATVTQATESTQLQLAAEPAATQSQAPETTMPEQTETQPPASEETAPSETGQSQDETTQPATADENAEASGLININTATRAQLETLPGIGEVLAQRIIDYREANGPFTSVNQLTQVKGIGEKRLAAIIDLITV